MKRPWNVAWGNSSSWSCRDDKEMCQTACCTCELDVLPFAYQTYSDFSDVLIAVAVAVGLAKAPHGWPLNWAPFQMNIVWCAFSITKKNTCSPLKKKKNASHYHLRGQPLFIFFKEEEKRRLCLNRVKPLKSPQSELLDYTILFFLVKLVFEFDHPFIREVKHHVYV